MGVLWVFKKRQAWLDLDSRELLVPQLRYHVREKGGATPVFVKEAEKIIYRPG